MWSPFYAHFSELGCPPNRVNSIHADVGMADTCGDHESMHKCVIWALCSSTKNFSCDEIVRQ
jgi:hypothetical protein